MECLTLNLKEQSLKNLLTAAIILCGLSAAVNSVFAQTWTLLTNAPDSGIRPFAISADGSKQATIDGRSPNAIWVSTNAGINWTSNNVPGVPVPAYGLESVAMSASGDKLAAVALYGSAIYTSTNYGATWTSNSVPVEPWVRIASSADGSKLVALGGGSIAPGPIYVSADSGMTWTPANAPFTNWDSVASSANGSNWVAAVILPPPQSAQIPPLGYIYTSTDGGLDWTLMTNAPNLQYQSVASSADGTKLLATGVGYLNGVGNPDLIYTSTNSGSSWISNSLPYEEWNQVASSADGRTLAAVSIFNLLGSGPGYIYTSTNSGTTWVLNRVPSQYWFAIASSADGDTLLASGATSVTGTSRIYISQTVNAPELNISPASGNLALSWLIPSTDFVVQQSSDLVSWSSITDAPALNLTNLNNELSLSPTNSTGFFRLMSQ
jgi:hypothetical protein